MPSAAFPSRPAPQPDDSTPFDAPELRRGLSSTLAKMEDTLRDTTKLVEAQHSDPTLRPLRAALEAGRGEDADYVLADNNLLWHALRGRA